MGIHRLWAHQSYKAAKPVKIILAILASLPGERSIRWWAVKHRMHHRYVDDPNLDPYAISRGFFFAHIGWLLRKPYFSREKYVDTTDLDSDELVVFQDRYYAAVNMVIGLLLPAMIASLWGDFLGGLLYSGFVARIILWHGTFCINSFVHFVGDQSYNLEVSARGSWIWAILTAGGGYHNYHHSFGYDYRTGVGKYDWDPSKWIIYGLSLIGLTWDLQRAPDNEIQKGLIFLPIYIYVDNINFVAKLISLETQLQSLRDTNASKSKEILADKCFKHAHLDLLETIKQLELDCEKVRLSVKWSPPDNDLPVWQIRNIKKIDCLGHDSWVIIDGYICDTSKFQHPGGDKILKAYYGKDATKSFYGITTNHSLSAKEQVRMMRVAKLDVLKRYDSVMNKE
jgi:stearoyl-CoA desaturase (Delta-9 desaturase)